MKKKYYSISILCVLLATIFLNHGFALFEAPECGTLPLDDPEDDVTLSTLGDDPPPGDLYDAVDIKQIYRNNTDLLLECYAPLNLSNGHSYRITICNGSDWKFSAEAKNSGSGIQVQLRYENDTYYYWNHTKWTTTVISDFPYEVVNGTIADVANNTLVFKDIYNIILSIDGCYARAEYTFGFATYYDNIIEGSNGVPSFTWLPVVFSLLVLLSIVFILQRKKFLI